MKSAFGQLPDGRAVHRLVLGQAPGPLLHLLDLGATVHRLELSGPDAATANVVLGHPTVADYLASKHYIGATIGRYANRIAEGRFPLDGHEVRLVGSDRGHNLHGGPDGFDRRLWATLELSGSRAVLELVSPDGDQGFPGTLTAQATFEVTADAVRITYEAATDAPTVVNMTNHAYFNLDGESARSVDDHLLSVAAEEYSPTDASSIPLGNHAPVAGTPFDFRDPTPIGDAVRRDHPQVLPARGIDHNFVISGAGLRRHAVLESAASGRRLELVSDQPGLQVYTGNFLDGAQRGTSGALYRQGAGIALEPQHFPDSPNRPGNPSTVLRPGEVYRTVTEWRFSGPL